MNISFDISVLLLAPGDLDVAFDLEAASMRAPDMTHETRIVQNAPARIQLSVQVSGISQNPFLW